MQRSALDRTLIKVMVNALLKKKGAIVAEFHPDVVFDIAGHCRGIGESVRSETDSTLLRKEHETLSDLHRSYPRPRTRDAALASHRI
jgi:hypothetical protein